jgi:protein TonB
MSEKINIYSDEWCKLVFEDKNQQYGAYILRKDSPKRHLRSIIIASLFFILAVSSPVILKTILPEKKEKMVEVTSMADVKMEDTKKKDENEIKDEPPPPLKSSIQFVPPVIKPDDEVTDEDQPKTQDELNESKVNISTQTVKGTDEVNGQDISDLENKNIAGDGEGETPFTVVEQPPDFPGGDEERVKFLRNNIRFPQMAREAGIQGTIYVTFVVSRSGKISNVKILRGIGGGCDEEAIRVIKMMPDWKPGKQNGQAVPVQFNMPIKFTLEG